jgi:hypothetical protein
MGFFDLFRQKKREVKEVETVSFSNLDLWVENKTQDINKDYEIYLSSIKTRKERLIEELEAGILGLRAVNWDKIRSEDRVKRIVKENLGNYVSHLERLVLDLKKLEGNRKKIDSVFGAFNKKAAMSYQKATFLIGKEVGVINDSVARFFKDLKNLEEGNRNLVSRFDEFLNIKAKVDKLREVESKILGAGREIQGIKNKTENINKEIGEIKRKIEEVKKTDEYFKVVEKVVKLDEDKEKLEFEIKALRRDIDFKALAKFWHENKKEMEFVKKYRANFREAFEKDQGKVLRTVISFLDNKIDLEVKLDLILRINNEITRVELGENPVSELESKIQGLRGEIKVLALDKEKEEKRIEKLDIEKVSVSGLIKMDSEKLGIVVSD